jgi:hypothetical protein
MSRLILWFLVLLPLLPKTKIHCQVRETLETEECRCTKEEVKKPKEALNYDSS